MPDAGPGHFDPVLLAAFSTDRHELDAIRLRWNDASELAPAS